MRKFFSKLAVLLVALTVLFSMSACTRIEPGYVGIKLNMTGGQKGVEDFPAVSPGWYFYTPFITKYLEFPAFVQTVVYTHKKSEGKAINEEITFQDKDSVPLAADIAFSYQIEAKKVPHFYVKFRTDDITHFTHGYMRNVVRGVFTKVGSEYTFDELNGHKKENFLKKVEEVFAREVAQDGIQISQFSLIEAIRPQSQDMINAINTKVQAIQNAIKAENELREKKAQAAKAVAEAEGTKEADIKRAEGKARANQLVAQSITAQLLEWEKIQVQKQWNGVLPTTMVPGNAVPFVNVK